MWLLRGNQFACICDYKIPGKLVNSGTYLTQKMEFISNMTMAKLGHRPIHKVCPLIFSNCTVKKNYCLKHIFLQWTVFPYRNGRGVCVDWKCDIQRSNVNVIYWHIIQGPYLSGKIRIFTAGKIFQFMEAVLMRYNDFWHRKVIILYEITFLITWK